MSVVSVECYKSVVSIVTVIRCLWLSVILMQVSVICECCGQVSR